MDVGLSSSCHEIDYSLNEATPHVVRSRDGSGGYLTVKARSYDLISGTRRFPAASEAPLSSDHMCQCLFN